MTDHAIAILVAEFNTGITGPMLAAARDEAATLKVTVARVCRVPGAYEIPLLADALLREPGVTALVVLGYIEKGETLHGEVMGHTVSQSLIASSLLHRKPVGLGIIGPGAVLSQAESRKESYARAAVRAAIAASEALRAITQ